MSHPFDMPSGNDEPLKKSELGTETEAEKHMKVLLGNQLDTKITLKEHFKKHREFTRPSTYTPLSDLIQGSCSLEKFKEIEAIEEEHQKLQRSGLTQEEIELYLSLNGQGTTIQKRPFQQESSIQSIKEITKKIKAHESKLSNPEVFSNAKTLSRHEMDLERTLYSGCDSKTAIFRTLIKEKTETDLADDDPFKHVKVMAQKLSNRSKKVSKSTSEKCQKQNSQSENCSEADEFVYDQNVHHAIVPLDSEEVCCNKLSTEEILNIPKFQNHQIGTPNKVLYLKNLHPKVGIHELIALFMRFETENSDKIKYRILSGRMKGQAFVTFPDIETAEKARNFAFGYKLREKPLIIEYGKKL